MKPADADAVANYVEHGGLVVRVEAAIVVSEREVMDYLAERGLPVKYFAEASMPYKCNGRRYSISGLLRLANKHRRGQQLPPMML
jgi:hypothetical protein